MDAEIFPELTRAQIKVLYNILYECSDCHEQDPIFNAMYEEISSKFMEIQDEQP